MTTRRAVVRNGVLVLALAGLVVALGTVWPPRGDREPQRASLPARPPAPPRKAIAVLGLRNASPTPARAWLSTALAEVLALELRAGDRLRTVPGDAVARVRQDLGVPEGGPVDAALLPRVRGRLGADLLLGGSYTAEADGRVVVDLVVHDAETGNPVAEARGEGHERALVELVSGAGGALRARLGVARPPGAAPASLGRDAAALRGYAEGLDHLRRFDASGALRALQRAVLADPAAAEIHSALAAAWSQLGYEQKAQESARRAFELAADLPLEERLPVEARSRALAGDWAAAAEIYRTLRGRDPADLELALALADSEVHAGRPEAALALLQEVRPAGAAPADPRIDLLAARAEGLRGVPARALALAQTAVARAEELGARIVVADALLVVSENARRQPDLVRARAACARARALYADAGDRGGVARALAESASVEWYAGSFEAARAAAEQSLATAREIGDRGSAGRALNALAGLMADSGRLAEARRVYVETLSLATELGDRDREWVATHNIGAVFWKSGDLPRARRALDESLVLAGRVGSARREAFSRFSIGLVLLDGGDLAGAEAEFRRALELARSNALASFAADPLFGLARVHLERDEIDAAAEKLGESASVRAQHGPTSLTSATLLATAVLELERGRLAAAESAAREAADAFRRDRARTHEGLALAVVAVAQSRQGRLADAERSRSAAAPMVAGAEAVAVRLAAEVLLASVAPARADVRRKLEAARVEAQRAGLALVEAEARLALTLHGADPEAVARDAETRGLLRIARRARAAVVR